MRSAAVPTMRRALPALLCSALAACNGMEARQARQAARMQNFEPTSWDFEMIARAAFETIEHRGDVTTIVAPKGLDPHALDALRHVHPTVAAAPGVPGTLPAGYFRVTAFTIEDGRRSSKASSGPQLAS